MRGLNLLLLTPFNLPPNLLKPCQFSLDWPHPPGATPLPPSFFFPLRTWCAHLEVILTWLWEGLRGYGCTALCMYVSMCALRVPCDPDSQMLLIANSWRALASTNRMSCWLWHQVEGGIESATLGWSINSKMWIPRIPHAECYQLVRINVIFTLKVFQVCLCIALIILIKSPMACGQHRAFSWGGTLCLLALLRI